MERENMEQVNLRDLRLLERIGSKNYKRTWVSMLEKHVKLLSIEEGPFKAGDPKGQLNKVAYCFTCEF